MDASELAALQHQNWISYLAASVSLNPEGLVRRERGIVALLGHVPMPFFNQILVEDAGAPAPVIRELVELARVRGDPFVVSLRGGTDDGFRPLMADLGLQARDDAATQAMTMHPVRTGATSGQPISGFVIHRVADAAGLADHRRTVSAGFGAHPSVADAMMGIGLLVRREGTVYVGYLDGQPVTSGFGWRTGRTVGVYNIATIPTARRRGCGEAMTARVLADAGSAGCDVAALQASVMGRPIYERMGFRLSVRYTGYVDPFASGD